MNQEEQKIDFKKWPEDQQKPRMHHINKSRDEMFTALGQFHNHVKYVIYILISMPTLILVLIRFWPQGIKDPIVYLIAGIILIISFPVGILSIKIIRMYYKVYVSCLIFATRLHAQVGYENIHPWFERMKEQAENEFSKAKNFQHLVDLRTESKNDTVMISRNIIMIIIIASLTVGIILIGVFIVTRFGCDLNLPKWLMTALKG